MSLSRRVPYWILAGALTGCTVAPADATPGRETGSCVDSGCFGGLECLSELCVDPDWQPPSGDDDAGDDDDDAGDDDANGDGDGSGGGSGDGAASGGSGDGPDDSGGSDSSAPSSGSDSDSDTGGGDGCESECCEDHECPAPVGGHSDCAQGTCVEACNDTGDTICGNTCLDLRNDAANCAACGEACVAPMAGTVSCVNAECVSACPEGLDLCGDTCVDLQDDEENCGDCGNACDSFDNGYHRCSYGQCDEDPTCYNSVCYGGGPGTGSYTSCCSPAQNACCAAAYGYYCCTG